MRVSYRVCDICGQKLTDGCVIDVPDGWQALGKPEGGVE